MIASAAALEFDRAAEAYRATAVALRRAHSRSDSYFQHLHTAQNAEWSSPAAEAFRGVVDGLRGAGHLAFTEAHHLAAEADLIAADLEISAQTARQLRDTVALLSGVDLAAVVGDLGAERVAQARDRAAEAVIDAGRLVHYLQDHSGIHPVLREAAARVW